MRSEYRRTVRTFPVRNENIAERCNFSGVSDRLKCSRHEWQREFHGLQNLPPVKNTHH